MTLNGHDNFQRSFFFPKFILDTLEEGKKNLRSKYIPYPILDYEDYGKEYTPDFLSPGKVIEGLKDKLMRYDNI